MPPVAPIAQFAEEIAPAPEIVRRIVKEAAHAVHDASHEQSGGEGPGGDECEDCCGLLECCCVIM